MAASFQGSDVPIMTAEFGKILDSIERLRVHLKDTDIELPQIVVLGEQSAGKSSVLQAITGVRLPRSTGICTRCPLLINLRNLNNGNNIGADIPENKEYAEIAIFKGIENKEEKKIIDLDSTSNAIEEFTLKLAPEKSISFDPIDLTIYRRGVPDLTLVDLPGITRVPLPSQPKNIGKQIKTLIRKYIANQQATLLNVISATMDFSLNESINLSEEYDAHRHRTLVCVTKIDVHDKEIAKRQWLKRIMQDNQHDTSHLQCKFIAVKCIDTCNGDERDLSPLQMRDKELNYFQGDAVWHELEKNRAGVGALINELVRLQKASVLSSFRRVAHKVNVRFTKATTELNALPEHHETTIQCLNYCVVHLLYIQNYISKQSEGMYEALMEASPSRDNCAESKSEDEKKTSSEQEKKASSGAEDPRISTVFNKLFNQFSTDAHSSTPQFFNNDYYIQVKELLQKNAKICLPTTHSDLAGPLVSQALTPVRNIINIIEKSAVEYIGKLLKMQLKLHFKNYPKLRRSILAECQNLLGKAVENFRNTIDTSFDKEKTLYFTMNNYYMDTYNKMKKRIESCQQDVAARQYVPTKEITINDLTIKNQAFGSMVLAATDNTEHRIVNVLCETFTYHKVVLNRLIDHVLQEIYYQFITRTHSHLIGEVIERLKKAAEIDELRILMAEDNRTAGTRAKLKDELLRLAAAKDELAKHQALTGILAQPSDVRSTLLDLGDENSDADE